MSKSRNITYRAALNEAMAEEMERDSKVFLIGEEVGAYQGAYKVSQGLLDRFGPERVVDTPISENGFMGLSVGAAMSGLRPIVEFMSFNFSLVAFDQIFSNAAKTYFMSGGQFSVPLVLRGPGGAAAQVAAQHSNCLEHCFMNAPGLKVVMPATPKQAKGLLKTAIRDENPVVFIEHELLYGLSEDVPEEDYTLPFGKAEVVQEGKEVTLVAYGHMAHIAETAAPLFAKEGLSVEIVNPLSLKPLDMETISRSLAKTHRMVIVEEGHYFSGSGAQIAESSYKQCFDDLDAPIARVCQAEHPLPYASPLEAKSLPHADSIIEALKSVCYKL